MHYVTSKFMKFVNYANFQKGFALNQSAESLNRRIYSYLLPAAGSILIGFIFFQERIFMPHMTLFQFVIVSIQASIIFNILKDTNLKNSIAAAFVLLLTNSLFLRSFSDWSYFLRDVVFNLAIFFSVYLFFRIFYLAVKPYFYPLAFGLLLALTNFIALSVLLIIHSVPGFWKFTHIQLMIGGLIGVGLGTGILINDKLSIRAQAEDNEDLDNQDEDDQDVDNQVE